MHVYVCGEQCSVMIMNILMIMTRAAGVGGGGGSDDDDGEYDDRHHHHLLMHTYGHCACMFVCLQMQ